jgi:AcrR family transcriptional regulator
LGYTFPVATAAKPRAEARRARERKIVDATRDLFDERGMQEARIDRIARRVGINKALIYRHFASKEELFALTVTRYLSEIDARLEAVDAEGGDPRERLRQGVEAFADYGIEHPAFLDCALSLLRQPAETLRGEVSEAVWARLGRAMAAPIGRLARALSEVGVDDADLVANQVYLQAIGVLHLARSGVAVRETAAGVPEGFAVSPERVRAACVRGALAVAGLQSSPSSS